MLLLFPFLSPSFHPVYLQGSSGGAPGGPDIPDGVAPPRSSTRIRSQGSATGVLVRHCIIAFLFQTMTPILAGFLWCCKCCCRRHRGSSAVLCRWIQGNQLGHWGTSLNVGRIFILNSNLFQPFNANTGRTHLVLQRLLPHPKLLLPQSLKQQDHSEEPNPRLARILGYVTKQAVHAYPFAKVLPLFAAEKQ